MLAPLAMASASRPWPQASWNNVPPKPLAMTTGMAPTGAMPVVMANGFGGTLFHEACGHGLEADAIAKGASIYAGKMGEVVAAPIVSAYDDGSLPNGWGSQAFDDEGVPSRPHPADDHHVHRPGRRHRRRHHRGDAAWLLRQEPGRRAGRAGQALGVEATRRRRDDVVGGDVARGDARGGHPRDGDVTERLAATVAGRHGLGLTGAQPVVQVAGEPPPFDDQGLLRRHAFVVEGLGT